jgi:group I intron endonuclease
MAAGIYKLTSPSGKVYIGQSVNLKSRMAHYKSNKSKSITAIKSAILKYGWDNFKVDILWSSEDNTNIKFILNQLEKDFINLYDCLSPNGYNLRDGGTDGYIYTNEVKQKISNSNKGREVWNAGKTGIYSEETLKLMSDSHIGKSVHSDEYKENLKIKMTGESNPFFGKTHTEETKKKISENNLKRCKRVEQYDSNDNFIKSFLNTKEASSELNISDAVIRANIRGNTKITKQGFKFKYDDNNK